MRRKLPWDRGRCSAIRLKAALTAAISRPPSGAARAVKSPSARRAATSLNRRSGRVSERLSRTPASAPAPAPARSKTPSQRTMVAMRRSADCAAAPLP